jgi:hypothetical protein
LTSIDNRLQVRAGSQKADNLPSACLRGHIEEEWMTEIKDAFGRTVSRRRFLAGTAAAAVGSGALLAGCGSGQGAGPGGGTGEGGGGDAAAGKGGQVTWGSWANPGEAERFRKVSKDY